MQYFKPEGDLFVGDCMPFFHEGTFRLFYLLDEGHHGALGGLGGHQWAQASSPDLVRWEHHPLAIPITEDYEGSICTGSVIFHGGLYYAFYATRMRDWTQHLGLAVGCDGVDFKKTGSGPLASPPDGYSPYHYRDPVVFQDQDDCLFHMLVTACLSDPPVAGRGGCLAHLVSDDLRHWEFQGPFILPGLPGVPECPDYFCWKGWFYLIFSYGGTARYRMSRTPYGPWKRPNVDRLDAPASRVIKTAAFTGDRRIGVAWIGSRRDDKDDGNWEYAGNAVFRELVQHDDGTLGTRFPNELTPAGERAAPCGASSLLSGARARGHRFQITASQGLGVAACSGLPHNARLRMRVLPQPTCSEYGFRLRADETLDSGYDLRLCPHERVVRLNEQRLFGVAGLNQPLTLDIILSNDIIDVCINGRRTLIDRCPERRGPQLYIYGQDSEVSIEIEVVAKLG
jgi:hypothetical protein